VPPTTRPASPSFRSRPFMLAPSPAALGHSQC
jgi:hypothetical protein